MDIVNYLKKIITQADKQFYTFIVGKINVVKLAGYLEIDMFVLVACPENTLIDSREYFKPILTPFELEIALVKGKEWSTKYYTDFQTILKERNNKEEVEDEEEEYTISLISGKTVANPKKHIALQEEGITNSKLTLGSTAVIKSSTEVAEYAASEVFLQRTFKGLEQNIGETPVAEIEQGRSGLPFTGYDSENL